jgi:hypothetical protein
VTSAEPARSKPVTRRNPPIKAAEPTILFGRFSLRDSPGWLVSVGVHLLAMLILLGVKFQIQAKTSADILNSFDDLPAETQFETTDVDQIGIGSEVTSLSAGPAGGAAAAAVVGQSGPGVEREVQQQIDQGFRPPEIKLGGEQELALPAIGRLTESIEGGATGTKLTGGGVENLSGEGVGGAMDRLTWEIAQSLHENKTTVIWLFDQSLSLKERRDAIADRFENVYRQLESMDEGGKGTLTTVAATYGKGFKLLNENPTPDIQSLIPKVRAIPDDKDGIENVFAAVNQLVGKFRGERKNKRRSVMIFIITDEKGDDAEQYLEQTIQLCRRAGIKVYTVGNAALFGREKGYVDFKDAEGTFWRDQEIDAGPETVEPEALAMGFWGGRGNELARMSSGYGPYALTRLCKETGGQFLIAQEDRRGAKFDREVMRNYQPDYRPIPQYAKSLEANKAKAALVTAAKVTKIEEIPLPRLFFPAYNDAVLRETMTESQKPAADLDYKINKVLETLRQGEKDREKVTEPRWRAAYDLAMGRALAMKARVSGYNQMLADMKVSPKPFQDKDSNVWRIAPSKTNNANQGVKKQEREAATYLKRVIDEHPGTPWQMLAEAELATPMGWEWKEVKDSAVFAAKTTQEEARRQIRLAEEKAREEAKKRPMTPQKERPKL